MPILPGIKPALKPCLCTSNADRISLPESPIPQSTFHRNDIILTSSEKLRLHSTMSQVHRDLAELDNALAHLEPIRERLLLKRQTLRMFSESHKALAAASSLRSMPPEVFAEIFSYFKSEIWSMGSNPARCEIMRLTHVCRQWRQIALSIPFLWKHIGVTADRSDVTPRLECIKAWLIRAKDCPLSVNIGCLSDQYGHAWNAILDVVLPQSCRWRHVIIACLHPADFSRVRNQLKQLETFSITVQGASGEATGAFEIAPALKNARVDVQGHIGYRRARQFELPWTQLSSFDACYCSSEHALTLLQMMPNIISFAVKLFGESNSRALINYPLRCSKLETLKLYYEDDIDHLLDHLELPSLTEFTFWEWGSIIATSTSWSASLISLIHRSACMLKSLTLKLNTRSQVRVDEIIRICPKLENLSISPARRDTMWGYSNVIRSLTVSGSSGDRSHPVPALCTLSVNWVEGFQSEAFVDMLESRWRIGGGMPSKGPVVRIESVSIDCPDAAVFDLAQQKRLMEFAAEGLDIDM